MIGAARPCVTEGSPSVPNEPDEASEALVEEASQSVGTTLSVLGLPPFTLVIFTQGRGMSASTTALPRAAAHAVELVGRL